MVEKEGNCRMDFESNRVDLLGRATFVAFDTETTGLWAISNRLVEIAAVKFRLGSDHVEEFQSLINPQRRIPAEATAVHGITDKQVATAPESAIALREFANFCGIDSILIAHNAPFDISFVGNEMDRAKMEMPQNLVLDTVDIFRRYFPGLASYSLISLSRHFGVAQSQEHRGLSDAQLVRRLFQISTQRIPTINTADELKVQMAVATLADWRAEKAELPSAYADLSAAVESGTEVEIVYQSVGSGESSRVIRPLQVHRLGPVHYIVAYCHRSQSERTFRLDRISKYKIL